jgi:putative transposase
MGIIEIESGQQVIANGKLAVIFSVEGYGKVKVRYLKTGSIEQLSLEDIEIVKSEVGAEESHAITDSEDSLDSLSDMQFSVIKHRCEVIKEFLAACSDRVNARKISQLRTEAITELGLSASYFSKLVSGYDESIGIRSLIPRKRGRKSGAWRFDDATEKAMLDAAKTYGGKAASLSECYRELETICHEKGLILPSRETFKTRFKVHITEQEAYKAKEGVEAAKQRYESRRGKIELDAPLAVVQMDHTLVDEMILADNRLDVIGRPWLTVLIDVYTRVILGYYLSLHVPSALSVACALTHAVFPKTDYLARLGLGELEHPFYGPPKVLHMDNAAEFTSPKFLRACYEVGIKHTLRPIGKKHYGGHVERLIGTLMNGKVHFQKGTTMSNAVARRGASSEKNATRTFKDFSRWFAHEVSIYNATIHSGIKDSPRRRWNNYYNGAVGQSFLPPIVDDPLQFKLRFMPEEKRVIHPEGINLFGRLYWDPLLQPYYGKRGVQVKYSPLSMRQVWVKIEGLYCEVRLSDLTKPDFTYEDYRASKFFIDAVKAGTLDDPDLTSLRRANQALNKESVRLKRRALRAQAAHEVYEELSDIESRGPKAEAVKKKPNYAMPPIRFKKREQD